METEGECALKCNVINNILPLALYETLYVNVIKLDQQRLPRHISLSCCLAVAIQ